MNEKQWRNLKPGDLIVNKRAPGQHLIVDRWSERGCLIIKYGDYEREVGTSRVDPHWLYYQLLLPQEKLI